MFKVIKRCNRCGDIAIYTPDYKIHDENNCGGDLTETNLLYDDFLVLCDISSDNAFLQAMIDLKEKDPIEFQMKMSQFKNQVQQNTQIKQQQREQSKVLCPYCNSVNVKKISGTERVASVAMMGIFSKKINKSFKCSNCGGTF